MAQLTDFHASPADAWREAAFAHLAASHRHLGGLIEAHGPLRLFANPTFDWTFFNTARHVYPMREADGDAFIRYVIHFYESRQLRPAWDVSDQFSPLSLPRHLMSQGFILDRSESLMALSLPTAEGEDRKESGRQKAEGSPQDTDYAIRNTSYSALTIAPIHLNTLDYFVHAWRQGFAMGPDTPISQVRTLFSRDLAAGWDFWCAWQDDRPVGTLAALTLDGVVQVANVSTLPAMRRQGIATRLMRHALDRSTGRGDWLVYLHAAAGSASERLYRRLGFQVLDQWRTFVYARGVWGI